ncbi:MAG: molecular chaperone DnaJ [Gammaproteobacteria bacterium]|nr:molecular chaperone DnaJ [Gammaproteobacteria bacterium]MDH3535252.1 molecular chaperone DnaJ [Gammaproteobacteria bacterium]
MARLLLLLGLAAGLFLFLRWLWRQPSRVFWQWLAVLLALGLLALVLTGRAHWLAAVFAAMLPFMRGLLTLLGGIPLLKRMLAGMGAAKPGPQPSSGQTSTVQSRYIRMTLNHDSGDIDGEILAGRFKGRTLNQLNLEALLQLLRECQDDEESVALLQAYLDRVYADTWQQQAGAQGQRQTPSGAGEMSREEALRVLGLSSDVGEAEIIEAHRRLMQKLHPDRGGSAYLAARVNLAKDTLLAR